MKLSLADKDKIKRIGYSKILNLSCGSYLVKEMKADKGIIELLGSFLCRLIKLKVPNNYLINLNGKYYLLSEDLSKEGIFVDAAKMFGTEKDDVNVNEAINIVNEKFSDSKIEDDILKMYFFDCLFQNWDRRLDNWGFLHEKEGVKLVAFDFDNCFVDDVKVTYLHMANTCLISTFEDLKYFLEHGKKEDVEKFIYIYELFNPSFVENILKIIMKNFKVGNGQILNELMTKYITNYRNIEGVLTKDTKRER